MSLRVVIAGSGLAGSLSAILLSDAGARVVLIDPRPPTVESPESAWQSSRSGCPQMHQTHNFLAMFWRVLEDRVPDLVDDLVLGGAPRSGSPPRIHARRTTVASALARAMSRRRVQIVPSSVRRLADGRGPVVVSLASGPDLVADLAVDATGRRARLADLATEADEPAGLVYLSRHYRARTRPTAPPGSASGSASGFGRGYVAAYASHDMGTYSCVLGVDATASQLRLIRDEGAFERTLARIPGFADLVRPDAAEALHAVQQMGNLRNTLRVPRNTRSRVLALGDALGTTDPARGRGSALAAGQAACLADLLAADAAPMEAAQHYYGRVLGPLREWFADAVESSRWRAACWSDGLEPAPLGVDPASRSAWQWLQTEPLDAEEKRLRAAYSQMCATPTELVAAGRARGDLGRANLPPTELPPLDIVAGPRGVTAS